MRKLIGITVAAIIVNWVIMKKMPKTTFTIKQGGRSHTIWVNKPIWKMFQNDTTVVVNLD